jgi:hypothetical protein
MTKILFAVAALACVASHAARAESNSLALVEGVQAAKPIYGGAVANDTGSEAMPIFGLGRVPLQANAVLNDTGSTAMPVFAGATTFYGTPGLALARNAR